MPNVLVAFPRISRPNPANLKVFWKDNQGNEGYIFRNSFHNQESYYPLWIESDEITFQGTRLKDNAVLENGLWVGYCYPWGYADNHPNSKEGSNFKIDWAVDSNGSPVDLDQIDFVKIMTAVNQDAGQMGEISTEVTDVIFAVGNVQMEALQVDTATHRETGSMTAFLIF